MDPAQPHHPAREIRGSRILVLDDEPENLGVLQRLLGRAGYRDVETSTESARIRDLYRDLRPDLLLLDLHMPGLDGFGVMEAMKDEVGTGEYFPILVLTGDVDPEVRRRALAVGARDFVSKPFEAVEVLLRIRNLLETRHLHQMLRGHADRLETQVRERTRELARSREEILQRLAMAAEFRDDATGRHAERVGILSAHLARALGVDEATVDLIRRAAPLHDLGKVAIPDAILRKPGPLDEEEYRTIRTHTRVGARILGGSQNPLLRMARRIALTHHERWDGAGYDGLAGEAIPLVGRIVAVADVYDSLGHARPYKPALPRDDVLAAIVAGRGRHFDPEVVDALLRLSQSGVLDRLDAEAGSRLSQPLPDEPPLPEARRSGRRAEGTRW